MKDFSKNLLQPGLGLPIFRPPLPESEGNGQIQRRSNADY